MMPAAVRQRVRNTAAGGLQALAAIAVTGGIFLFLRMLWLVFHLPAGRIAGGLIFAAVFLPAMLLIAQILRSRARAIHELGESAGAALLASILLRTAGEVYAAFGLGTGAGGCVCIWLGGRNPLWLLQGLGVLLPYASGEAGFAGGVSFLLALSASSFLAAILLHFMAEASAGLGS